MLKHLMNWLFLFKAHLLALLIYFTVKRQKEKEGKIKELPQFFVFRLKKFWLFLFSATDLLEGLLFFVLQISSGGKLVLSLAFLFFILYACVHHMLLWYLKRA